MPGMTGSTVWMKGSSADRVSRTIMSGTFSSLTFYTSALFSAARLQWTSTTFQVQVHVSQVLFKYDLSPWLHLQCDVSAFEADLVDGRSKLSHPLLRQVSLSTSSHGITLIYSLGFWGSVERGTRARVRQASALTFPPESIALKWRCALQMSQI